jgi:hypothetical protein
MKIGVSQPFTPAPGNALKYLRVNAAGTAFEYVNPTYA